MENATFMTKMKCKSNKKKQQICPAVQYIPIYSMLLTMSNVNVSMR